MSQGSSFSELVDTVRKQPSKDLPPAIPSNETIDGPIDEKNSPTGSIEPKKPIFDRYDTYITCPGCGAMVRKGTKRCECGYDLSGPISRLGRRLRHSIPFFLCITLIITSAVLGFFFGQKKMTFFV